MKEIVFALWGVCFMCMWAFFLAGTTASGFREMKKQYNRAIVAMAGMIFFCLVLNAVW